MTIAIIPICANQSSLSFQSKYSERRSNHPDAWRVEGLECRRMRVPYVLFALICQRLHLLLEKWIGRVKAVDLLNRLLAACVVATSSLRLRQCPVGVWAG